MLLRWPPRALGEAPLSSKMSPCSMCPSLGQQARVLSSAACEYKGDSEVPTGRRKEGTPWLLHHSLGLDPVLEAGSKITFYLRICRCCHFSLTFAYPGLLPAPAVTSQVHLHMNTYSLTPTSSCSSQVRATRVNLYSPFSHI